MKDLQVAGEQRHEEKKQAKSFRLLWKFNLWAWIDCWKKKGLKRGNGHENEKKGKKLHLLVKVHWILLNALWNACTKHLKWECLGPLAAWSSQKL